MLQKSLDCRVDLQPACSTCCARWRAVLPRLTGSFDFQLELLTTSYSRSPPPLAAEASCSCATHRLNHEGYVDYGDTQQK